MLNRLKIVTSLVLVLVLFGLLQLASGGLFFNSLKHDKENFTILQTVRQQQSGLNGSGLPFTLHVAAAPAGQANSSIRARV